MVIRADSKHFRLLNGKCEAHFMKKKNPREFRWTGFFRRLHKKGITEETVKKHRTRIVKVPRSIIGTTWEQIVAKRDQPESVRKAAREATEASLKKKKEESKKKKEELKAKASAQRQQSSRQKSSKAAPSMKPKATSR